MYLFVCVCMYVNADVCVNVCVCLCVVALSGICFRGSLGNGGADLAPLGPMAEV